MEKKIAQLMGRYEEVETLLGDPNVINDRKQYRELTQEHSYLGDLKQAWQSLQKQRK